MSAPPRKLSKIRDCYWPLKGFRNQLFLASAVVLHSVHLKPLTPRSSERLMSFRTNMPIPIIDISQAERDKILALRESHFCDLKGVDIQPAKLTRTIAALSNAEGGEVYVGVDEDKETRLNAWNGFNVP